MAGYRPPYTLTEDMKIINFIIAKKAYNDVKGRKLWQDMEESGQFKRTWQSLKERFRKQIVTNLHRYNLTSIQIKNFKSGSETYVAPRGPVTTYGIQSQTASGRRGMDFINMAHYSSDETE